GKLDRLPGSDQRHLRDMPDQRQLYADMRDLAINLREEGQRLGRPLTQALDRYIASLPERFEEALVLAVWRDGNMLRRLDLAHREASKSTEPDEAKLEPVIAAKLGGLLDLHNVLSFGDDGLRLKDEVRVAAQERDRADRETEAAAPVVRAILATPDIATERARDDLNAEAEAAQLSASDPYAAQVQEQGNRTKRNWIAALLSGLQKSFANLELTGRRIGKGAQEAMGKTLAGAAICGVIAYHVPILEFVATYAPVLTHYVGIAFANYPHLPDLIDRVRQAWDAWRRG
ncbi:hypothetical protein, partial [Sphingomonas sp.]|uniref:hypothetical protein n=1 Tax=Sphingomonas sp. TaxID=28214 RepID=UPI001DECB2C4